MARDRDNREKESPTGVIDIRPATRAMLLRRRLRLREVWEEAMEKPWLWLGLFLLLATWTLTPGVFLFPNRAVAGAVAGRDYVATHSLFVNDDDATRARQREMRDAVLRVYDLDPRIRVERDTAVARFFANGRRLLAEGHGKEAAVRAEAVRELTASPPAPDDVKVTPEQAALLAARGFSADLEERVRGSLGQTLRKGVVANKDQLLENRMRGITVRNLETGTESIKLDLFENLGYPGEARDLFESEVRGWSGFKSEERRLLVDFLVANLPPNLLPNRSETLARQDDAVAVVGEVSNQIRKGQVIVRKGDIIHPNEAHVIAQMRGDRLLPQRVPSIIATFVLLALAALAVWLAESGEQVADHSRGRLFSESLLLLLIGLLGAKLTYVVAGALAGAFESATLSSVRSYSYAIPFATLALVASLLLGRYAALVLSVLFSALAARLAIDGDALWLVLYSLAGSLGAVLAVDRFQFRHRLVTARVGMVVGVINAVMVLVFAAVEPAERGLAQIGFDLLCALAGGLLVTAATSFALPILEWLLGITTDIKLLELSNANLPLLRRLAFEAPGTFQHSLMVANLAKEGCEAIGADPVLAYTSGLYHDVGKVLRPDYFVENQRPGHNRHDKLLPSMSALILINHVKEGVELAREHAVPRVLRDAIRQHHGTRLMKFFYTRALEQKDEDATDLTEEKYRYPGPRPQNKVMGVLMLADAIEAASRTLSEPTTAKIRGLIRTITDDCLQDGQLDETDLTLSDLRLVAEAFHRVLANIFHQRIDYPGFDFNAVPKREKKAIRQAS
jgi:putative nucleotidyltransferase with HDIG domain